MSHRWNTVLGLAQSTVTVRIVVIATRSTKEGRVLVTQLPAFDRQSHRLSGVGYRPRCVISFRALYVMFTKREELARNVLLQEVLAVKAT